MSYKLDYKKWTGKEAIQILLTGTNTSVQPLSKLVQEGISHLIQQLQGYKTHPPDHHEAQQALGKLWQDPSHY